MNLKNLFSILVILLTMLVSNIVKSGEIIIPKIKPSIEKKEYIDEYILPIPKPYIKKKIIIIN